ncbi:hypothetical protein BN1723_008486 [Verticillium longisporum]|uniref:Major facilitator superfamily (MFS) profile domain-containing protein n=1 Tax=Verticillium longisporum TaxID=100787 RepID=A0A0G4KFT5_VERLO|nr:hypothetical protein BN1723_008486 [Verticillium longisporum]CRK12073.1 hypothetical protein BN1708_010328 [Verticillium longisporum]
MTFIDPEIRASSPPSPEPFEKPAAASLPEELPGTVFLISAAGKVLKLPIPSESTRDPLNWTPARRVAVFSALMSYTAVCFFENKLPAALMGAFHHEFDPETNKKQDGGHRNVESLNTIVVIANGLGYLISIPLSAAVGRRPILLATCLLTCISTISAGLTETYIGLAISIFFQGLAVGQNFGISVLYILDATFVNERPYALALYWSITTGLISMLLIPLPYITDTAVNWKPVYRVWIIPCVISLLVVYFFIPESFFLRPAVAMDGRILTQSSSETVRIYDNWEDLDAEGRDPHRELADEPKSSLRRQCLKVTRAIGTEWKAAGAIYMQMLLCFCNPLVLWVSLLGAVVLCNVVFLNLTQVMFLSKTLEGDDLRLMNTFFGISGGVSSVFAYFASGPLIARCTRLFTARSGGTRQAEVYLVGFMIPVVAGATSIGLHAAAITNEWPPVAHYINFGLANFSFICGFVATIICITEAFPPWASASLSIELFTLTVLASVLSLNLGEWAKSGNILGPCAVLVALLVLMGVLAVPLAFWGKNVRQYIHGKWSQNEKGAIRPQ